MHLLKTGTVIRATSVLIGVLAIGSTAFAFNQHQHRVQFVQAKQELKAEQASLHSIQS